MEIEELIEQVSSNKGGMDLDRFIQKNADPIWLHENEMWEHL